MKFVKNQKVICLKDGKTYTVIFQKNECQVFVYEGSWIHPANLRAK